MKLSNDEIHRQIAYEQHQAALHNAAINALVYELARREEGYKARSVSEMAEAIQARQALCVIVPAAEGATK